MFFIFKLGCELGKNHEMYSQRPLEMDNRQDGPFGEADGLERFVRLDSNFCQIKNCSKSKVPLYH